MSGPAVLDESLLQILACPIDKRALLYFPDERILYNPRLRRLYPIADGCPVMLAHRAVPVPEVEHGRLMKRARCADASGTSGLTAQVIAAEAAGDGTPDAAMPGIHR